MFFPQHKYIPSVTSGGIKVTWDRIWICFQMNAVGKLPSTKVGEHVNPLLFTGVSRRQETHSFHNDSPTAGRLLPKIFFKCVSSGTRKQPQTPALTETQDSGGALRNGGMDYSMSKRTEIQCWLGSQSSERESSVDCLALAVHTMYATRAQWEKRYQATWKRNPSPFPGCHVTRAVPRLVLPPNSNLAVNPVIVGGQRMW